MDTRKNDNLKIKLIFFLTAFIVIFPAGISITRAETPSPIILNTPFVILRQSQRISNAASPTNATGEILHYVQNDKMTDRFTKTESEINKLKKALAGCKDNNLSFEIKYRIGVLYFKADMLDESKAAFELISKDTRCPEQVRACSLNMAGQISRLIGDNKSALDAFEKAATISKRLMLEETESLTNSFYSKLWCSVLFGKAEICQQTKDFDRAIIEYNRLHDGLAKNKLMLTHYGPLVNDRLSQLYLKNGKFDKYLLHAKVIIDNCPQYYRTPLIELETECVKLIRSIFTDYKFTNGAFDSPAMLTGYIRDNKLDSSNRQLITAKLDELYRKNRNTYAGIVICYHYAFLSDALGDKDKAAELFSQIFEIENYDGQTEFQKRFIDKIKKYSKIQYAVIAGEKADYDNALKVLGELKTDPNETHISQLAKSVNESIRILKREVSANELAQK